MMQLRCLVAPRSLGIKVGDVISSAQAGGIMHKVNKTASVGEKSSGKMRSL